MDYIRDLKNRKITFNGISEANAEKIIKSEYSFYKLMEYSSLFSTYVKGSQKGCFIHLDFYQLYVLAQIDEHLSYVLMHQCLKIERRLKTILLYEINSNSNIFSLEEYIRSDQEYLYTVYRSEYFPIIKNKFDISDISELSIDEFLDVIQFGTLERLIEYFNNKCIVNKVISPFSKIQNFLPSVRRLRNSVAHNNSIISQLKIQHNYNYDITASFLGNHGVNKKNLKTNISKLVIYDYCNVLHLFSLVVHEKDLYNNLDELDVFLDYCRLNYSKLFDKNETIKSAYNFISKVIKIYKKC